jgi:hypothetical protein
MEVCPEYTYDALGLQLAQTLGCPVELRLIRLSAPYLDVVTLHPWGTGRASGGTG